MTTTPNQILRCQVCGTAHDPQRILWVCPCGGILDVEMAAHFPWPRIAQRPTGLWRYREALPIAPETPPVSLGEPMTPLVEVSGMTCRMFLKLDYLFPTGSFKDRGASVLLTKARELGVSFVVEDSSGNAGAAIAAYAAAAGMQAKIFVPASAPAAKTAPIICYGADLVRVPGTRADTADAAWKETQHSYYASHVWNPFFLEGTKTVAFEIWEQMGGVAPKWVIAPVGHGTMLLGLAKGFRQLQLAGLLTRLPRIVGVQTALCAPLVQAFQTNPWELPPVTAGPTQADGIAISRPLRWRQILAAVQESDGRLVTVSEEAIRAALFQWASRGWLMEPTSATALAAFAGLSSIQSFAPKDTVVIPITGSGAKSAQQIVA